MTDSVKERFCEQRDAIDGEPRCTICGRYGEYICDETEDDICSLECKHILLSKLAKSRSPIELPATDDCFYVKDTHSSKVSASPFLVNDQTLLLREKLKISVRGASIPPPILSFASCSNIPQMLQKNLEAAEFEIPTSVQMQAIPAAMTGQSLLVSAATGSGKTASYLVPIISYCANFNNSQYSKNPLAIVLAPTREICIQVEEQAKLLGKGLPFKTALVVGGDPMPPQIHRINEGASLIIATPGRLIHLLTKNISIELDMVSILVLDEVDCMLQRGFFDQVMQIYRALSQPQILMYSATISKEIKKMASGMAKDVSVLSVGYPNKPNGAVKQVVIWVEDKQKKAKTF
jgi:ATP-dependent RNA helicase DDX59